MRRESATDISLRQSSSPLSSVCVSAPRHLTSFTRDAARPCDAIAAATAPQPTRAPRSRPDERAAPWPLSVGRALLLHSTSTWSSCAFLSTCISERSFNCDTMHRM